MPDTTRNTPSDELIGELRNAVRRGVAEWLSPPDASTHLGGIPVKTLEDWRARGVGPAYTKCGRHVRYARTDLDAFMHARRIGSTHDRGEGA